MLDFLRKSRVAAGEAGGITQHIGAFQVPLHSNNLITFIDTPGHSAFSAIRSRGTKVTDIVVLVVAVEDGVMPQTEEVISLVKKTKLPVIVAMNKWDKLVANHGSFDAANDSKSVRKLKDSLARLGIELEEFGGNVQCIPTSALTGFNMDLLQDSIIAEAEMIDLSCDPNGPLRATIIEARNAPSIGTIATAIIRQGTLRPGTLCVADNTYSKVRSLKDTNGSVLKYAGPSQPCDITGWKDSILPLIGSEIVQCASEVECKKLLESFERECEINSVKSAQKTILKREALDKQLLNLRKERSRDLSLKPIHLHSYDCLSSPNDSNQVKKPQLEIILYTDVTGSLEALQKALKDLPSSKVDLSIIYAGLGTPPPSSLNFLNTKKESNNTSSALIAFNVSIPKSIEKTLQELNVKLIQQSVIYHLIDEIKETMASLLPPIQIETVQAIARILQLFPFGKEVVAGCMIDEGLFSKPQPSQQIKFYLERNGRSIWNGPIKTLRHLKKDITQAQKGMECGIVLDGLDPNLLQVNDLIKCVKITQTPQKI